MNVIPQSYNSISSVAVPIAMITCWSLDHHWYVHMVTAHHLLCLLASRGSIYHASEHLKVDSIQSSMVNH